MPYSGPGDAKLPSNVKKMTARKRRAWVRIWNATHARCMKDGGADCEGMAFRMANGVMKTK
jgi:hypothetical protein